MIHTVHSHASFLLCAACLRSALIDSGAWCLHGALVDSGAWCESLSLHGVWRRPAKEAPVLTYLLTYLLRPAKEAPVDRRGSTDAGAFAYGGIYPGVLHARGKLHQTHRVQYSVGRVGTYKLHVALRSQGRVQPLPQTQNIKPKPKPPNRSPSPDTKPNAAHYTYVLLPRTYLRPRRVLPGSPFLLKVVPGLPSSLFTCIAASEPLPLSGVVGLPCR